MSQAIANPVLTTQWNIASMLHLVHIVDPNADVRSTLHVLELAGFHCKSRIIHTRTEFLDSLSRFPCDLVLAEYHLRGWTGMEAFSAMRQAGREAPFILVTQAMGEEEAVECIKQGVTDYVLKDHLSRLPVVVARALDEKAMRDARNFMVEALRQSEANSLLLFAHNPLPMWVLERENLQILQV
ncbi:MAG: response regulator, partial [Candidatus Acidiferrales bacterium]